VIGLTETHVTAYKRQGL